jgi:hypothetical protein
LLADISRGFPDGLVDVLRLDVEYLGNMLLGLQRGLVHRLLELAFADDDQGGLPGVDELAETGQRQDVRWRLRRASPARGEARSPYGR